MKLIFFETLKVKDWSGGTTTELFIYPQNSAYNSMNFDFRISTATIEIERSEFTSLPGVKRTLMVLEGTLELNHEGHHSTILEKYEKDSFLGDWKTTSGGRAVDFNLMILNPELNGFIRHIQIGKKKEITFTTSKHGLVFIHKGSVHIEQEDTVMTNGDAIYFNQNDELTITGISNVVLIFVIIE